MLKNDMKKTVKLCQETWDFNKHGMRISKIKILN